MSSEIMVAIVRHCCVIMHLAVSQISSNQYINKFHFCPNADFYAFVALNMQYWRFVVLPHDIYIYILYVIIVITISNSLRSVPFDNLLRSYCKFELISWSLFNCWINAFCISHTIFIWSFVFCFYLIVILWSACDWSNLFSQFLQLHVAVT